jgi:hypothetical protein
MSPATSACTSGGRRRPACLADVDVQVVVGDIDLHLLAVEVDVYRWSPTACHKRTDPRIPRSLLVNSERFEPPQPHVILSGARAKPKDPQLRAVHQKRILGRSSPG